MRTLAVLSLLLLPLVPGCTEDAPEPAPREAIYREVTDFGGNPGQLKMYEYVPANTGQKAGLVLVLHGCGMTAQAMKEGMQWNELADQHGFYVVYAEQDPQNHYATCFNFYVEEDLAREGGEVHSLQQMVEDMKRRHSIDERQVFVTGFSAGAFMAQALLVAYPEVFSRGAVLGGGPYRGHVYSNQEGSVPGRIPHSVRHLMSRHGYDPETKQYTVPVPNDPYAEGKLSPAQWGELVRQASPGVTRYPAVLFIHGVDSDGVMEPFPEACDGDRTLHPDNLRDEVAQWTDVHGTDPSADEVESGFGGNPQLTRRAYKRGADTVVETFTLQGLGHFVPVEPGEGPRQGGHANPGAPHYTQAVSGFHSTYWTARFFALVP